MTLTPGLEHKGGWCSQSSRIKVTYLAGLSGVSWRLRRRECCLTPEATWTERDGKLCLGLSLLFILTPVTSNFPSPLGNLLARGLGACSRWDTGPNREVWRAKRTSSPALAQEHSRGFRILPKSSASAVVCTCNLQIKVEKYFKLAQYMGSLSKWKTGSIAGKIKVPIYFFFCHCNTFVFSPKWMRYLAWKDVHGQIE